MVKKAESGYTEVMVLIFKGLSTVVIRKLLVCKGNASHYYSTEQIRG